MTGPWTRRKPLHAPGDADPAVAVNAGVSVAFDANQDGSPETTVTTAGLVAPAATVTGQLSGATFAHVGATSRPIRDDGSCAYQDLDNDSTRDTGTEACLGEPNSPTVRTDHPDAETRSGNRFVFDCEDSSITAANVCDQINLFLEPLNTNTASDGDVFEFRGTCPLATPASLHTIQFDTDGVESTDGTVNTTDGPFDICVYEGPSNAYHDPDGGGAAEARPVIGEDSYATPVSLEFNGFTLRYDPGGTQTNQTILWLKGSQWLCGDDCGEMGNAPDYTGSKFTIDISEGDADDDNEVPTISPGTTNVTADSPSAGPSRFTGSTWATDGLIVGHRVRVEGMSAGNNGLWVVTAVDDTNLDMRQIPYNSTHSPLTESSVAGATFSQSFGDGNLFEMGNDPLVQDARSTAEFDPNDVTILWASLGSRRWSSDVPFTLIGEFGNHLDIAALWGPNGWGTVMANMRVLNSQTLVWGTGSFHINDFYISGGDGGYQMQVASPGDNQGEFWDPPVAIGGGDNCVDGTAAGTGCGSGSGSGAMGFTPMMSDGIMEHREVFVQLGGGRGSFANYHGEAADGPTTSWIMAGGVCVGGDRDGMAAIDQGECDGGSGTFTCPTNVKDSDPFRITNSDLPADEGEEPYEGTAIGACATSREDNLFAFTNNAHGKSFQTGEGTAANLVVADGAEATVIMDGSFWTQARMTEELPSDQGGRELISWGHPGFSYEFADLPPCDGSDPDGEAWHNRTVLLIDEDDGVDPVAGGGTDQVVVQCDYDGGVPGWYVVWPNRSYGITAGHSDGANCAAGEIPLGVDANGAVQGCYEPAEADITDLTHLTMGDVHRQAATDCTTETGGVTDEQCHELDDNTLYVCESGPCNGSGWVAYGGAEVNDLSSAVTWANIPDANVPSSAVTQHESPWKGCSTSRTSRVRRRMPRSGHHHDRPLVLGFLRVGAGGRGVGADDFRALLLRHGHRRALHRRRVERGLLHPDRGQRHRQQRAGGHLHGVRDPVRPLC